jgi:multiple sugar transport system permease protein
VPTYAFFVKVLGWGGTWLPLIVPQMFGNAYNVFLLRQYFLTIPREMEEAALVVGAGRIRIFISVILPQAVPALTAVALFHFFFAWNDFFGPLIYLAGNRRANPITVGLAEFNGLYNTEPQLILAAAIISMILPLTIFFLAQRVFIQGIVITGVDK